jgi:biotin operon repressor
MVNALMDGRALTATELADCAGVSRPTASAHLKQLLDAGLLALAVQGRHRYYRLADADVAHALEHLQGLAGRLADAHAGAIAPRTGPRDPALRHARICYDHLAGELGVWLYQRLLAQGALVAAPEGLGLSADGLARFGRFGIVLDGPGPRGQRPLARACLDWSERREHLAGRAGAALLQRLLALGWLRRRADSRVLDVRPGAQAELADALGLPR